MKTYEAVADFVVLKPLKQTEKVGSIVLPDQARKEFGDHAEVISVGSEVRYFEVGDIVLRPDPARIEISNDVSNEVEFMITAEEDIMAKVVE